MLPLTTSAPTCRDKKDADQYVRNSSAVLAKWAAGKPTIKALYAFGSYARGEAGPDSDLDLAFDFIDVDDPLSELIEKAAAWKAELNRLTGIVVKDVRLSTDVVAQGPKLLIFSR